MVAWIEIDGRLHAKIGDYVATCVVAWIEIFLLAQKKQKEVRSPPAWWRGLKS